MTIVYTVNGEGMGHASRSSVVIEHLRQRGHRVIIVSSGERPLRFLRERFGDVHEVRGLHMVYANNSVQRLRTSLRILAQSGVFAREVSKLKDALSGSAPHFVITDFDFRGYLIARAYRVPLISIDNVQYLRFARTAVHVRDIVNYLANIMVAKLMVPRAEQYFITTFDPQATVRSRAHAQTVSFMPPLLRPHVFTQKPVAGDHVLVYQTSASNQRLLPLLKSRSEKYVIYNSPYPVNGSTIVSKEFHEMGFIRDLATARAVITNGGFTVITEALYFKKPILSVPIANHYEQLLNARILSERKFGMMARRLTNVVLDSFMRYIQTPSNALATPTFDNERTLSALDAALERLSHRR